MRLGGACMADVAGVADGARRSAAGHHGAVGVLGAAGLVAGSMVGSGVYLLPATLGAVGSISLLGWLVAGIVAIAIASVFVQLASRAPDARGIPAYIQVGLGRQFGVQGALLYWCSIWVGIVPLALAAAGALGFIFPVLAPPEARTAVMIGLIWLGVAAAWLGPKTVTRVEGLTLVVGLAPVLLAATVGWVVFRPETFVASWNPQNLSLFEAAKTSGLSCFWAFLGLEAAAAAASVVRDPARNVPRATLLGVAGVMVVYVAVTGMLMGILPAAKLAASTAPFAEAAQVLLGVGGPALAVAVAACMALRASGCLTGWTLVAAETTRTAADAGDFPAFFRTRPGERASATGLLVPGVLMTILALATARPDLAQQFTLLANVTVLLCLYTYLLAAVSLIRLSGKDRGTLVSSGAAILGTMALIATARPLEVALSVLPILAAGVLHFALRRSRAAVS